MKKIGIITFQETYNYGAVLQNYALQKAIQKFGCTAETIDYKSEYISKPYRISHLRDKGLIRWLFGVIGYIIYLPRKRNTTEFRKLIRYSQPVTKNNISNLNNDYDCFITGSDQVFNYKLTGGDNTYLLDFVKDKSKCASYAASLGVKLDNETVQLSYKNLLSDFKVVSLREESAAEELKAVLGKDTETVVDPCMLLTEQDWMECARIPQSSDRYVLVYQLGVSGDLIDKAREVATRLGLKLIFVPFPVGKPAGGKWKLAIGPAELIGYIHNADYVITDSYHGTIFSILFHRRFYTKTKGTHESVGVRIEDLLSSLNLSSRNISEDVVADIEDDIDYEYVDGIIEERKNHSMSLLIKILE